MPHPSITHAWDRFWDRTGYLRLHHLGAQIPLTQTEAAWTTAVTELQEAGPLTIAQIEAITELVERTAVLAVGLAGGVQ